MHHTSVLPSRAAWLLFAVFLATGPCVAQTPNIFQMTPEQRNAYFEKINAASSRNWSLMLETLHQTVPGEFPPMASDPARPAFTFQRPGSTNWYDSVGNTYIRSAWGTWNNYDESRANSFRTLPNPLVMVDGRAVTTPSMWWKERRPEIAAAFEREIYGAVPPHLPGVQWIVKSKSDTVMGGIPVVETRLLGRVDNAAAPDIKVEIELSVTLPAKSAHPVPVIMEFGFLLPPGMTFPGMPKQQGPTWQEMVLARGWGYAMYVPTSVQPDNGAGLTEGIIGLVNKGKTPAPGDWGALRAWAWGASQCLDYFASNPAIDAGKVAIEGVSRYGKAVLVTMANEPRFAVACVASSGKGGGTFFRRNYGEAMGNICSSSEYHWFAGNLLRRVTSPESLSVDAHEMIALCAPRPVFISCGSPAVEGNWIDGTGQFLAAAAADPVYILLGAKGLGTSTKPPIGTGLLDGALVFRQHEGGHMVGPNWPFFLDFAARWFAAPPASGSH